MRSTTRHVTLPNLITSGPLSARPPPGKKTGFYLDILTKILYFSKKYSQEWEIVSPVAPYGLAHDVIWGDLIRGDYYALYPPVNMIYATPIMIRYPMTISHVCLPINVQAGNVKAAIYDGDGVAPGASPEGATRLAVTASEAVAAEYTRMDMALTEALKVTIPGLKWLAVKGDDVAMGLSKGLQIWSTSSGPTKPAWAPGAYMVDPGGSYDDDMPETFPAAPTLERSVGMGVLVQSVP